MELFYLLQEQPELAEATVFACGPNPMMFALEKICNEYKMNAQIQKFSGAISPLKRL